jgi:hypothetical protein
MYASKLDSIQFCGWRFGLSVVESLARLNAIRDLLCVGFCIGSPRAALSLNILQGRGSDLFFLQAFTVALRIDRLAGGTLVLRRRGSGGR